MTGARLDGAVVVVAVPGGEALVRRLVDAGATVVVTGTDGDAVGRVLADLSGGRGRLAHFRGEFTSDADADALVEFIAEQFAERPPVS